MEDPQSKQLRLQKEIMHKPHNRISHWLNVLQKKRAQLNHVYPSVFPLHTQSHSSWCSKGTSVNDLCNPRTPVLGFSWRTWRKRRKASREQQVLYQTPRLWVRLHWKHTGWQEARNWLSSAEFLHLFHPLIFIFAFTSILSQKWLKHVEQILACIKEKSLAVSYFYFINFKG